MYQFLWGPAKPYKCLTRLSPGFYRAGGRRIYFSKYFGVEFWLFCFHMSIAISGNYLFVFGTNEDNILEIEDQKRTQKLTPMATFCEVFAFKNIFL